MSAAELRKAAETLRAKWDVEPVLLQPDAVDALADLLDEVWAWREEGLGLIPDSNIGDAWLGVESRAKALARLINGGAA